MRPAAVISKCVVRNVWTNIFNRNIGLIGAVMICCITIIIYGKTITVTGARPVSLVSTPACHLQVTSRFLVACWVTWLIPVTGRSKACVGGRPLAEIAGSNPAGGHCSLCLLCCELSCKADHSSRGVVPNVVCLSVIAIIRRPWPTGGGGLLLHGGGGEF